MIFVGHLFFLFFSIFLREHADVKVAIIDYGADEVFDFFFNVSQIHSLIYFMKFLYKCGCKVKKQFYICKLLKALSQWDGFKEGKRYNSFVWIFQGALW